MTDPAEPSSSSGRQARLASTGVGAVLGLAALVFVGRALLRDRAQIGDALDEAEMGWVGLAVVLAALGMLAIAVPWRHAIRLLGDDLPVRQVVPRYFLGEIGKYVPGGVWPILGRGELARRGGVRRAAAYGSVFLSLFALYLAAMFVVVGGLPSLLSGDDGTGPIVVLGLLPLGLVALHPRIVGIGIALVERIARRRLELPVPPWRSSIALVARYVPAWLAIGGATWAVARSLDPTVGVAEIGAAATLSWLIGFVLVPVPGGVGVREAAFIAAAGSLDSGIAAAVAVAARLIFVIVDAGGALIGSVAIRSLRSGQAARSEDAR